MGYTPQLLAGSWVGCDDQFIHISNRDSYEGQGARAAMPIWAYFYEKVSHDPNIIGIDANATFTAPEIAREDIGYDRVMGITPTQGAALEDAGNGTAQDYGVPNKFNDNEEIKAESDFDINKPKETKPDDDNPYSGDNAPAPLPKPKEDKKPLDLLKNPADKPKKPKAVMQPKVVN